MFSLCATKLRIEPAVAVELWHNSAYRRDNCKPASGLRTFWVWQEVGFLTKLAPDAFSMTKLGVEGGIKRSV